MKEKTELMFAVVLSLNKAVECCYLPFTIGATGKSIA